MCLALDETKLCFSSWVMNKPLPWLVFCCCWRKEFSSFLFDDWHVSFYGRPGHLFLVFMGVALLVDATETIKSWCVSKRWRKCCIENHPCKLPSDMAVNKSNIDLLTEIPFFVGTTYCIISLLHKVTEIKTWRQK